MINKNKFHKLLPLNQWIKKSNLQPNKSFGQNFLFDLNITDKIVKLANLNSTDRVLEIGPGLGPLTISLLNSPIETLDVVEKDNRFEYLLNEIVKIDSKLKINFQDALKFDIPSYINKIVSNLPYNISVLLIMNLIENNPNITEITVLIQKEVGERFVSKNNSKSFGIISLLSQIFMDINILYHLPPQVFIPAPKVNSTLVKFTRKNFHLLKNYKLYKDIVSISFNQRRKLLINTLGKKYTCLQPFLLNKRCENLTVDNIIDYGNLIKNITI